MADPDVITLPPRTPTTVSVDVGGGVRFSPNELRVLRAETGKGFTELMGPDAEDEDRMQTLAWLQMRRDGNPVRWDECGDIEMAVSATTPDPTTAVP